MTYAISTALFAAAFVGLALLSLQVLAVIRFRRAQQAPTPQRWPAISILKPLCGIDDDLEKNLELFTTLDYPRYEVVLGVRSTGDLAYPVARSAARRWPHIFRVVLQQGEPGLNPKINQLITLARAAHHDILVVSDSNVRVPGNYLSEIAALFENEEIGLVTHSVAGVGEKSLGALMDNLYMTTHVSAGIVAAKVVANQDLVVGKSMAFRRADLDAMGGFESAKDVLAEDFTMGRRISSEIGKRVCVASQPVLNITQNRSVSEFIHRYERWSVMQRQAVGYGVYGAKALMNPFPTALLAALWAPSLFSFGLVAGVALAKTLLDAVSFSVLRHEKVSFRALRWGPVCDLLVASTWVHGLFNDCVNWRGNILRVVAGTRLVPVELETAPVEIERRPEIKIAA